MFLALVRGVNRQMTVNIRDATDRLLTRREAAELLGVAEQTLAVWHCLGRYDLPVVKVGRSVRYRLSDLMTWLESRTRTRGT